MVFTKKLKIFHYSDIYPQGQNSKTYRFSRNDWEGLKIKWTDITFPLYEKTCFSISEWTWHTKNDLVILQKLWEFPNNTIFFSEVTPYMPKNGTLGTRFKFLRLIFTKFTKNKWIAIFKRSHTFKKWVLWRRWLSGQKKLAENLA